MRMAAQTSSSSFSNTTTTIFTIFNGPRVSSSLYHRPEDVLHAEGSIASFSLILCFVSSLISSVARHALLEHSHGVPSCCARCCCLPLKSHRPAVLPTFMDMNLMDVNSCIWLLFLWRRNKEKEKKKKRGKKSVYVNITIVSLCYLLCLSAICRLSVFIQYIALSFAFIFKSFWKIVIVILTVVSNILVSDRT